MTSFREEISELEHQQWIQWSKNVYERYGHDDCKQCWLLKQNWEKNWIPYSELPEHTKDFDREWADKVLKLFEQKIDEKIEKMLKDVDTSLNPIHVNYIHSKINGLKELKQEIKPEK